jgi:hypothetical protein
VLKITMHSNGKCTQMANALLTTTMFVQLWYIYDVHN